MADARRVLHARGRVLRLIAGCATRRVESTCNRCAAREHARVASGCICQSYGMSSIGSAALFLPLRACLVTVSRYQERAGAVVRHARQIPPASSAFQLPLLSSSTPSSDRSRGNAATTTSPSKQRYVPCATDVEVVKEIRQGFGEGRGRTATTTPCYVISRIMCVIYLFIL